MDFEEKQIKEKVEDKIIDWIAFETNGRLLAFKPEKDADLVVEKKGDYTGEKISLQIKMLKEIPNIKIKCPENYYFLFVSFDIVGQKIDEENVWLVPAFPHQINKKVFIDFLIEKLVVKNKPKPRLGFKSKQY